jgi:hypothetical protein
LDVPDSSPTGFECLLAHVLGEVREIQCHLRSLIPRPANRSSLPRDRMRWLTLIGAGRCALHARHRQQLPAADRGY